jgi:two-component system chemotaxis response regulator CheB
MPMKDIIVIGASAGGVDALQRLCAACRRTFRPACSSPNIFRPRRAACCPSCSTGRAASRAVARRRPGDRARAHLCRRAGPSHAAARRQNADAARPVREPHPPGRQCAVPLGGDPLWRARDRRGAHRPARRRHRRADRDQGRRRAVGHPGSRGRRMAVNAAQCAEARPCRSCRPARRYRRLLLAPGTRGGRPSLPVPEEYLVEDRIAAQEFAVMEPDIVTPGRPSHLSCPDCGGVLNQIEAESEIRFRCQVGHAFSALGLADAQSDELERALGVAAGRTATGCGFSRR